jgi:hypothetical protein
MRAGVRSQGLSLAIIPEAILLFFSLAYSGLNDFDTQTTRL